MVKYSCFIKICGFGRRARCTRSQTKQYRKYFATPRPNPQTILKNVYKIDIRFPAGYGKRAIWKACDTAGSAISSGPVSVKMSRISLKHSSQAWHACCAEVHLGGEFVSTALAYMLQLTARRKLGGAL
jgi:hypothetical protein